MRGAIDTRIDRRVNSASIARGIDGKIARRAIPPRIAAESLVSNKWSIHGGEWLTKWRRAILAPLAVFNVRSNVRAH
jgi:hypothetical protein